MRSAGYQGNLINIKAVQVTAKKSSNMMRPVKHDLGLKVSEAYGTSCKCGEVYIGETG
jgi:hypothetical protein